MDRNKIAQSLSTEELIEFLDVCWKTPGLTLAKLQELAAERGILVSLMGAKSFRDSTFKRHIETLRQARELSEQIKEVEESGGSIANAASTVLSRKVFDAMTNPDPDQPWDLDTMSKIVKRLQDGEARAKESSARVAALESMLREREAKEEERKAKSDAAKAALARQKNAGLTPETIKAIEEALNL